MLKKALTIEGYKVKLATTMTAPDLEVKNAFGNEFIKPSEVKEYTLENGEFKIHVKPLSWNVFVFEG